MDDDQNKVICVTKLHSKNLNFYTFTCDSNISKQYKQYEFIQHFVVIVSGKQLIIKCQINTE